jgi:DNA-binding transcriptional LysR family regulator
VAFVVAVELASVRSAADALNLTQSAVTKRLQALERRAGARLLDRGRFGVRPTAAGRLLYPEAKQALAALQQAEDVLAEHRNVGAQALSLAASHTIGEFLLPGWLAAFRVAHPQMRVQVEIVNSRGVLTALRERDVEIGFVEGRDVLDGYEQLTVCRDTISVVVAAEHRWSSRRSIQASELTGEPYVTREEGSGTRAIVGEVLATVGVTLQPTLETASLQSVKRALLSGGFSLLSTLAVEAECRQDLLRTIPVRDVDLSRPLLAIRAARVRQSALAQGFWSWLQRTLSPGMTGAL